MSISTLESLRNSENRVAELNARRVAMGYTYFDCRGHRLHLILWNAPDDWKVDWLRLPLPIGVAPLWVAGSMTKDDIARCAGLRTYDLALPLEYMRAEYGRDGSQWPVGVWSYDDKRVCGEFYSLQRMLDQIAVEIIRLAFDAFGLPDIAHTSQPPRLEYNPATPTPEHSDLSWEEYNSTSDCEGS